MELGFWLALVLYLLGVGMYLTILEATEREDGEEPDPNAVLYTAFIWPYVAVRVMIDRARYGDDGSDDGGDPV